ncbi:hypothetical protein PCK2_000501 [Pneumocystis canis]|nr:hypothetical protein PCK2_000501 [Pneumocystis canis]
MILLGKNTGNIKHHYLIEKRCYIKDLDTNGVILIFSNSMNYNIKVKIMNLCKKVFYPIRFYLKSNIVQYVSMISKTSKY